MTLPAAGWLAHHVQVFRVWAPTASAVELVLPSDPELSRSMRASWGGWWEAEVAQAGHGTDYAFSVDGGEPLPDPRSSWQPEGVHGPSRVFDPLLHRWSTPGWPGPREGRGVLGAMFYELHVGTFTDEGTLDSALARLPYLVDLGIDVVELMPLGAFEGRWGWGYDGSHPGAVHEAYGGPGALQRFVDQAHQAGLAVCLDVVENHLGPSGNYLSTFGPYFTERTHTPWGAAVNLDGDGSHEVRRWILDRALRWFADFRLDALRLDAVHELHDESPYPLLAQLADETAELARQVRRPLALVAESDVNDPATIEPTQDGGLGMTAQWDDDVHHALHAALTGERQGYYVDFGSLATLAKAMTRAFIHDGGWSTFREAEWGRPVDPERHPGHRFLAYLQNHDQIGNRAIGDRLSPGLSPGLLAAGAALVLLGPYTPMLFMGEEWGAATPWRFFTDFDQPALAQAVRTGRQEEFSDHGWQPDDIPDPQEATTRSMSVLDWSEQIGADHARLLDWYRTLITLRRNTPDIQDDHLAAVGVSYDEDARWFVLTRGQHLVVVNLGDSHAEIPLPVAERTVVLAWDGAELSAQQVVLPRRSVAVLGPAAVRAGRDAGTH
jgi:maltooligosyltrehalose trehalohydrolase